MNITRVGSVQCKVGEGPLWDVTEQALYFIDLLDCRVWRYRPASGLFRNWKVPSMIGSMALRQKGGVIVALQDGVHWFDLESGQTSARKIPPGLDSSTQLNDGKVDAAGRFVFGSQARSLTETRPLGAMYSMEADAAIRRLDDNPFTITNGPCWSPDGRTFYVSDSIAKLVYAYDYDVTTGCASNRRQFADTTAYGGIPDGATVDADGRLWVTVCGGGKIVAFWPDGSVERVIEVPTAFVTSVMFGGAHLDQLYFTSINGEVLGMPSASGEAGGGLFVIEGLGVTGLREHRYRD
jgi:L-arabinonolactonase